MPATAEMIAEIETEFETPPQSAYAAWRAGIEEAARDYYAGNLECFTPEEYAAHRQNLIKKLKENARYSE